MNHTFEILKKERRKLIDQMKKNATLINMHSKRTKELHDQYLQYELDLIEIENSITDLKKKPSE